MSKKQEYFEKSVNSALSDPITQAFETSGQEILNPVEKLERDLDLLIEEALQDMAEPWRTKLLEEDAEHPDKDLDRLYDYVRGMCLHHMNAGYMHGCSLRFPEAVCEALQIDPGKGMKVVPAFSPCQHCGTYLPEHRGFQFGQRIEKKLFTICPICSRGL